MNLMSVDWTKTLNHKLEADAKQKSKTSSAEQMSQYRKWLH